MNWQIPDWWTFLLLALAAYRTWRLLAYDTIFDDPRARLTRGHAKLTEWLTCPWCAGLWIVVAWWLAWVAWSRWTLIIAALAALAAVLPLVEINLGPDD